MPSYVPFVNGASDIELFKRLYGDAPLVRISLPVAVNSIQALGTRTRLWIDSAVDGFIHEPGHRAKTWNETMSRIGGAENLDSVLHEDAKCDKRAIEEFAAAVLTKSASFDPYALSVPQLPFDHRAKRKRLNALLAEGSGIWHSRSRSRCPLVLPLVLGGKDDYRLKPRRNSLLKHVQKSLAKSGASLVWVVDTSVDDQRVTQHTVDNLGPLFEFHRELRQRLETHQKIIVGPYWGIGLVLWAREFADYVATGLGSAYRYYVSGGRLSKGNTRVALAPLRRTAVANSELVKWLDKAMPKLAQTDPTRKQFSELRDGVKALMANRATAKEQVARFHKHWMQLLEEKSSAWRALTLYQDLSAGYVLGKSLGKEMNLPSEKGYAQHPYAVAETLMLLCL